MLTDNSIKDATLLYHSAMEATVLFDAKAGSSARREQQLLENPGGNAGLPIFNLQIQNF